MSSQIPSFNLQGRRYWVVSPNVKDNEKTISEWRQASLLEQAAFMGWEVDQWKHGAMGPKFAGANNGISPGDVILIARRHQNKPEIVGFGVVRGNYDIRSRRVKPPENFASLRRLSPFRAWTGSPSGVPLMASLKHTKALAELHPRRNESHKAVCEWLDRELSGEGMDKPVKVNGGERKKESSQTFALVDRPESHQLDFRLQTKAEIIIAKRTEAALVDAYAAWIEQQGRKIITAKFGNMQCDAYEKERHNLVEAKSSCSREYIRMAVGQLLDYAYQGGPEWKSVRKAILLPKKPTSDLVNWLEPLGISVIWRQGRAFLDNANGDFT